MSKVQESKANKTKAEQNKNKLNYTLAAFQRVTSRNIRQVLLVSKK